jgi:hypothetical protein
MASVSVRVVSLRAAVHRRRCAAAPSRRLTQTRASSALVDAATGREFDGSSMDACVVLGGGLGPDGSLPPWVLSRIDTAARLATTALRDTTPVLCSGSWTPHKPAVVLPNGHALAESTSMAEVLLTQHGLSAQRILKESASADTVGNAYFTLTAHALPAQWKQVVVVTSSFHLQRTVGAFDWVFGLAGLQPVYIASPDDGLSAAQLSARAAKEAEALATLRANAARITTLASFHAWLFATHACYSASRQGELLGKDGKALAPLSPALLASY